VRLQIRFNANVQTRSQKRTDEMEDKAHGRMKKLATAETAGVANLKKVKGPQQLAHSESGPRGGT